MKIRWKRGQAIVAILVVMLMLVTAACGNGDDDDDDGETPVATSTATTGSANAASSPTEAEDEAEATPTDADATATEAEDDAPTSTTSAQATATGAETDEPTATTGGSVATSTEASSGETPTTGDGTGSVDDLPEIETLDPELLPNFSMTMNFEAANLSGTPQTSLQMEMQQSSIGNYHFVMNADDQPIEVWTVAGQSWTSVGGEVIESPTGPLFNPADLLTTGELIPEGLNAREDGTEEVNGRQTTKWVVDGADYVAYMNEEALSDPAVTVEMTNGAGEVTVYIDNELNIMILAEGDVTWDNSDGTQGSLVYDYEIHDIGSTAEVVAPV